MLHYAHFAVLVWAGCTQRAFLQNSCLLLLETMLMTAVRVNQNNKVRVTERLNCFVELREIAELGNN